MVRNLKTCLEISQQGPELVHLLPGEIPKHVPKNTLLMLKKHFLFKMHDQKLAAIVSLEKVGIPT